jgi:hypothetical protein
MSASYSQAQEAISFSKVIRADSIDKTSLFASIHEWFAATYNSANDVIQMADEDAGTIIGKGTFEYSYGKSSHSSYDGFVDYTIKAYVKDNRFKVVIENFSHVRATSMNLGLITSAEEYTSKGMYKDYNNRVWSDLKEKSKVFSERIFSLLEEHTNQPTSVDDNW